MATIACSEITGDPHRVVAIEIPGALERTVEEADTLQLDARAVDASGEIVSDAVLVWQVVDTVPVGFAVDSTTGLIQASAPGSGHVQARVDNLVSGTITITVTAAPDSIAADVAETTLPLSATAAPAVTALVWDLTSEPDTQLALAGKAVHFELADPAPGSAASNSLFLTVSDTVPGEDPHRVTAVTGLDGRAGIVLRRVAGATQPDSAVIHATALTALGDTVAGSPVRLLVHIEN